MREDDLKDISGFDFLSRILCGISLVISLWACHGIFLGVGRGWWDFYDAIVAAGGLVVQVPLLVLGVSVPMGILQLRGRLRFSRGGWWMLGLALGGVTMQAVALWLIPSRGAC